MQYRTYGATGKSLSVIGAGTMRFPTPITPRRMEESAEILLHAHAQGINYFDTAPLYCDDRSEEITGLALRQMKPGSYYVSTKCSAQDADGLRRGLERSLRRLGVPRIHFFHIWCLLRPSEWEERKRRGAVAAALQAREEGLIEHLVFSAHMDGAATTAVIADGVFEGVTLGYNALNFPFRQKALDAAHRARLGVVVMNPLGGGLIPRHARRFQFLRGPDDPDVVTAALRFVLSHPAVTCALVGFSRREEVDHAVRAVEGWTPYDAAHLAALRARICEGIGELCTGCGYCLPCPRGVPIVELMDAFNHYLLEGCPKEIPERLRWAWELAPSEAARCDGCGRCETACTQHLPIVERVRAIAWQSAQRRR